MKTTIEISDPLLQKARRLAEEEDTTLRAIVERALRQFVEAREKAPRFRLQDTSVSGEGLSPEFQGRGWEAIRAAIYEGRGE